MPSEIIDMCCRATMGVRRLIIPHQWARQSRGVYEIVETTAGLCMPSLDLYLNIALDGQGETARSHARSAGSLGKRRWIASKTFTL